MGTTMTLNAAPTAGSTFMGWTGACAGTGACVVTVSALIDVNATFDTDRVDRPLGPNPVPIVGSLSPTGATTGSAPLTLTVNGTGFVPTSVVRWNGAARTTTFISRRVLQASLSKSDLTIAGSPSVTVFNPTPGGGTSAPVKFTIAAASTPPSPPSWPRVTTVAADATGVTFAIVWDPVNGVASYRYGAGFGDGTALQDGTTTLPSIQLRMPYHVSGGAVRGFVCVASISPTGQQSADHNCSTVPVPARPAVPPTSTPTSSLPTGLVAAYAFDETSGSTVADASGNNNTGTLGSTVTRTTEGRFGGALVFNGESFVTIPNSGSLALTSGMTLEAWVLPTASTGLEAALMKEQPGGLVYALYTSSSSSRPMVYFNTGPSTNRHRYLSGPTTLPLNTWTHLAATYDGSTLRLYINGAQVSSQPHRGSLMTSNGALRIGGDAVWGEYFRGMIDEVRIYNRALTPTEIVNDLRTRVSR
jgi:hypothetical protein